MASETMRTLTPQDAAKVPQPGLIHPVNISFSPDDALITFLLSPDRSRTLQLYTFDPEDRRARAVLEPPGAGTTDENVSLEEALRRERVRQWGAGVTDYAWAKSRPAARSLARRRLRPGRGRAPQGDRRPRAGTATFSPDGGRIAFVRAGDIYVVDAAGGEPAPLTSGAGATASLAVWPSTSPRRRWTATRGSGGRPTATRSHSPKSTSATSRSIASSIRARTRSARPRRKIIAIRSPAKRMPSSVLASCPFRPARRPG